MIAASSGRYLAISGHDHGAGAGLEDDEVVAMDDFAFVFGA
jgi:hydroxymethylpyrimidine/phosphomethylpyrimidine kinase